MTRLRVLVVSAWDPRRLRDGASLLLFHHLRHLAGEHDITVLTPDAEPPDPGVELPGVDLRRLGDHRHRSGPVRDRLASLLGDEPAHVHWVEHRALLAALDAAAADPPDVLHLFGWGTAQLRRRLPGVPAVHVAVDPWAVNRANRGGSLVRRLADLGQSRRVAEHEARHYPEVDRVVVVAPHDAETLGAEVPTARVVVITNGVDAGPEPPDAGDVEDPVIGFHGALEARANVAAAELLVRDILPRVVAEVPDATALLVGRDPPPELRSLDGPRVTVTGAVPDVRPWLERMAVYVAPLTSGTGFKNKVIEAMAAGRPVVASSLALSGIGAGRGTVAADDPTAAAVEVVRLLTDPALRARTGAAARRRVVEDFTWERSAGRVGELWREVVAEGGDGT